MNSLGQLIENLQTEKATDFFRYTLDLTKHANGIYFIHVTNVADVKPQKLVVVK